MVDLAVTSVPAWAVAPAVSEIDPTAREIQIFAVGTGDRLASVVDRWRAAAAGDEREIPAQVSTFPDGRAAVAAVPTATAAATVGTRFMVAGSASDCAAVRAVALQHGWIDQEIRVGTTSALERLVTCAHCSTVTTTEVGIEGLFVCPGCARNLYVYYHFSRTTGTYLGFMVDAEDADPLGARATAGVLS